MQAAPLSTSCLNKWKIFLHAWEVLKSKNLWMRACWVLFGVRTRKWANTLCVEEHKFRIYAFFTIIFPSFLILACLRAGGKSYSFIRRFCLRTCHFPYDAYMNFLCSFGTCRRKSFARNFCQKKLSFISQLGTYFSILEHIHNF